MKTNDLEDFEADYVNPDEKSRKRKYLLFLVLGIIIIIIIIILIILRFRKKDNKKKDNNNIDMIKEYDFYNFAIQNPRIFCYSYSNIKDFKECLNKTIKYKTSNKLTIHGMWPSILNKLVKDIKKYNCNNGTTINVKTDEYKEFYNNKMKLYWPSSSGNHTNFWTHEYNKHGYCFNARKNISTNNYTYYFEKTIEFFESKNLANLFAIISPDKAEKLTLEYNKTEFINLVKNKTGITPYVFCADYNKTQMVYEIQFALDLNLTYITNDNLVKEVDYVCKDNSKIVFKFDE